MKRSEYTITNQATPIPHIGIIDSDRFAATVMRARLRMRFPGSDITIYKAPVLDRRLDVYFVDYDFHGSPRATQLLAQIRKMNPNALVVAMSSTLDNDTLKNVMDGGCDAFYDKNKPVNSEPVFEVIGNYLNVLNRPRSRQIRSPFTGTLNSFRKVFH
ncbi:MAG: DNA-binding NarL/FixJ family response regulator [Lentimonas sp.]|jgi:DNA-binding NarL/FixJ family response regulator